MKIKVFYNQSCKICNTEINHYKRICNDKISWVNIVDNKTAERLTSASYPDLIRRIHVLKDKRLLVGAKAFMEIWRNIPKYHFLYKLFKIKPMFFILHYSYEAVAFLLFLKNKRLLKK